MQLGERGSFGQDWHPQFNAGAHPEMESVDQRWEALSEAQKSSTEFKQAQQDAALAILRDNMDMLAHDLTAEVSSDGYLLKKDGTESVYLPSQMIPPSEVTEWRQRILMQVEGWS